MSPISRLLPGGPLLNNSHRCALVLGHPGHELKVFGWMSEYKPRVFLITDGSGHQGLPRTLSTAALLTELGSEPGELFGALSDGEIYRAMLDTDVRLFLNLVDRIADSFLKHKISLVAGDAAEGFNPTHDLCRALINAAVVKTQRATGRTIANFEFSLTEWEQNSPEPQHDDHCHHFLLDDPLLASKLAAAAAYVELKNEVRMAIALRGKEYFRVECLRGVVEPAAAWNGSPKPAYEAWGQHRVQEGKYRAVIRFDQHIRPILEAILEHALYGEPLLVGDKR